MLGGLCPLGVEVDEQDHVGHERPERRLDGMVHLGVAVYLAPAVDRVILRSAVTMNLWVDRRSGLMSP